ncbi:MAG: STAS-like domain-containing protein [Verrucomicrobia bacterium]|nr:STAS-like domain-containing protein [Verrucomicrobiota bacterium]
MNTIAMNQWGDFLGTRFLGEEARRAIHDALAGEARVCLDFAGVRGVSHSFADEAIGILVQEIGLGALKTNVRFANLNEEIKTILRFVVSERSSKHLA